ncbi:MAG: phage tail protein [Verrucomicrobia bacterium]|nr:phage tail protein [Verrucomicrobiota bacterium]MBV9656818.1 phage tail protein [Verrucomicrobiota bacterium]
MSTPFIGEIRLFPYPFAPRGWAFCQGQLLAIAQNTALFSLLGTTYGGNGQATFGLPDLRGRAANSAGQGPGLSNYTLGQVGGHESTTLTVNQMPAHSHRAMAVNADPNVGTVANSSLANASPSVYSNAAPTSPMNAALIAPTGGSQPFSNLGPYLTLNYCIALEGVFPSRS